MYTDVLLWCFFGRAWCREDRFAAKAAEGHHVFLFCWLIGSSSLFIDELSSNPLRVVNSNVLIDLYDLDAFCLSIGVFGLFLYITRAVGEERRRYRCVESDLAVSKLLMLRLWYCSAGWYFLGDVFWRVSHWSSLKIKVYTPKGLCIDFSFYVAPINNKYNLFQRIMRISPASW